MGEQLSPQTLSALLEALDPGLQLGAVVTERKHGLVEVPLELSEHGVNLLLGQFFAHLRNAPFGKGASD